MLIERADTGERKQGLGVSGADAERGRENGLEDRHDLVELGFGPHRLQANMAKSQRETGEGKSQREDFIFEALVAPCSTRASSRCPAHSR